jgi:hypothetical protein
MTNITLYKTEFTVDVRYGDVADKRLEDAVFLITTELRELAERLSTKLSFLLADHGATKPADVTIEGDF